MPRETNDRELQIPPELTSADFKLSEVMGIGKSPGVIRHDPSNIMKIDGKYHVWYTRYPDQDDWDAVDRSVHTVPNYSKVWLAVSEDGRNWTEIADVLEDSRPGSWHECCKHAPFVVLVDGILYMFYTARCGPDVFNKRIGLAVADSPAGPFKHSGDGPLLGATAESRLFDTIGQDDSCVLKRGSEYWLYFKAYGFDLQTREQVVNVICVAFADAPYGPYRRWDQNSLVRSHTGCLWSHREGVAMISDNTQTIQYCDDGIHFRKASEIRATGDNEEIKNAIAMHKGVAISDPGVYCPDSVTSKERGGGIRWGLAQLYDIREASDGGPPRYAPFLVRFDCNLGVRGEEVRVCGRK